MPNSTLDMSNIASELATYATDNKMHIFARILTPGIHESGATTSSKIGDVNQYAAEYITNDRVYLTEAFINDVLQPGNKDTFDPKPNVFGFKTRQASVEPVKIDQLMTKTKILQWYKTYMGQVKGGKYNPETYPFEEYIVMKIVESSKSNLRNALWNAVKNPAGDSSLDLFDGWLKQLNELILDDSIPSDNIIVNGGPTAANAIDETEKLVELIPDEYLYHPDMVCVSSGSYSRTYNKAFSTKYTSAPYNGQYEQNKILGTDIPMLIEPSLRNYKFPIFTLKGNLAYLYDDESAQTDLSVDYDKRTRSIAYVADFQAGTGVSVPDLIWTMK